MPPPIGSVLDIGPMYATVRRQTDRQTSDAHHRLMPPTWHKESYIHPRHCATPETIQHCCQLHCSCNILVGVKCEICKERKKENK